MLPMSLSVHRVRSCPQVANAYGKYALPLLFVITVYSCNHYRITPNLEFDPLVPSL